MGWNLRTGFGVGHFDHCEKKEMMVKTRSTRIFTIINLRIYWLIECFSKVKNKI
jgi:hypothetical protein